MNCDRNYEGPEEEELDTACLSFDHVDRLRVYIAG